MGEYESNMNYAKSVGADMRKPCRDMRNTSQRVTDEMNELHSENKRLRDALQGLMDLNISGEKYGSAAKDVWDEAVEVLKTKCMFCGQLNCKNAECEDDY